MRRLKQALFLVCLPVLLVLAALDYVCKCLSIIRGKRRVPMGEKEAFIYCMHNRCTKGK